MKNKIFITLLIFGTTLFSTNISFAQFPQWTEMKLFAGNWHDVGYSIYIDKHDNYYIAGQLQDPIPGSTPANFQVDCREVPAPRIGEVNGFVLRYDSNRNLTLQITLPGRPMEVRADSIGNIYVVGRVEYDYSFDGIDTIFNGGTGDGFITKYSPEGNLLWYRIVKSGDNDAIVSIDIRKDGNIAICGYANGDATWFLEKWITAPIDFVATLNSDGRLNWVTSISQDLGGGAVKNRYDLSGNIVIAGGISDSTNAIRGMLAKLNGYSGEIMWHKVVGETGNYYVQGAQDVTIAPDGSYLFGGEFSGNGIFGSDIIQAAGYLDIFLMKTDTSGNIKWVTTGGSVGFDKLYSIFQCKSGDICFTGGYSDGFKMGDSILYSKGYTDVYAGAIDSTGKLKWILHGGSNIPGHETDFFYHEYGAGIFEDSKEQLQIVGTTIGNGSFGNLRYIASENTWENVFWATIGSNKKNYSVYYPCDTFSGNSLINIYPNPFKDEFTIQLYESFLTEGESSMRLFDVSGRLIMTEKTSSNLLTVKNLQLLASGVYIAEIVNKHRRKTVKLIKEN